MKQEILSNEEVCPGIFRMGIAVWKEMQSALPGQFVHVRISHTSEPLLRRPFSIHELNAGQVKILYRVVGRGTKLLSEKKCGEKLDAIGPLGHGFHTGPAPESALIVAGGMGVAPMLFLAQVLGSTTEDTVTTLVLPCPDIESEIPDGQSCSTPTPERSSLCEGRAGRLANRGRKRDSLNLHNRGRCKGVEVFIGAKTSELILCEEDFKKLGCSVRVSTDDGSYGKKGFVSFLFKEFLKEQTPEIVYACGPVALLKEVADICSNYNIPCQVSLENQMACGVGACLGCVIKAKDADGRVIYRRVCREGPVFDANVIVWSRI